jgi:hypothetical protein
MPRIKKVTMWAIAILLIGIAASFVAPTPRGNDWLTFHAYFAVALGAAIAFVAASIMFIMGLGGFTDKLKKAYRLICISLVALSLAFVQLPITLYLVDFSSFWQGGNALLSGVFFLVALSLIYTGSRALARLFGVTSLATKVWFVVTGTVGFAVVAVLAPHVPTSTPEATLNASLGSTALSSFIIGVSALLMFQIKRTASVMYTNMLAWMSLSYAFLSFGGVIDIIAVKALGDQQWYLIGAFPLIPLFLGGLLMLRAAYSFNTVSAAASDTSGWVARNFFGKPLHPQKKTTVSSVDIVVYAASLVSSPRAIDPILDNLRRATSSLTPGAPISANDQDVLLATYTKIEDYLLNQEPVRKFTKESLRRGIAQRLRLTNDQTTFWHKLV